MKYLALIASLALCSCSIPDNDYVNGTVGFYKATTPADPAAQFGLFVTQKAPVEVIPEK